MATPRVSVIVPAYNAAAHIEGTLASVLAQTLPDLEVVVVDDGSSDDTVQRVAHMATRHKRVRLLRNDRNRGPSYTRNAAMDAAVGDWIAVLDADDCMQPDRLATLLGQAEQAGVDILADDLLFVRAHGEAPFDHLLPAALFKQGTPHALDAVAYLHRNPPGGSRGIGLIKPIIRTQALRRSGVRYREDLRLAEDLFFYLELILAGARLALLQRGMYEYLVRPDSLSRSKGEADVLRMIRSYDTMLEHPAAQGSPEVMALLRQHRDEMQCYSLPKHRLARALRKGQLMTGLRILLAHPGLPLQVLRRKLSG